MSNGLSKKEKKVISKAITQKLEQLGIVDEIKFVPSGKKVKRPIFDPETNQFKVEDGKLVFEELDVPMAMNAVRRTVRVLRNSSVQEIEAFLALEVPSQSEMGSEELTDVVEVSENGTTQE